MIIGTPFDNKITSYTTQYNEAYRFPYEMSFILTRANNYYIYPSALAHEILHTFGAPELYMPMSPESCGITEEYVNYAKENRTNDIMRYNHDLYTGEPLYDRISNEITDITAYYIGLTDHSDTVDEWGLGKSQHDQN